MGKHGLPIPGGREPTLHALHDSLCLLDELDFLETFEAQLGQAELRDLLRDNKPEFTEEDLL